MLEATHLTCIRGERTLFRDLNFTVAAGDIVQIAGANGAGKTSLLRILAGLSRAEQGEVCWQQQPIHRQRENYHAAMLWIGHQPGIKANLTAGENLRFYHPAHQEEALLDALDAVNLTGFDDVAVGQLSAGQQRRVALARLWLTAAPLWILDEPLTAIDIDGVASLMALFTRHADNGGSIILTTHQPLPASSRDIRKISLSMTEPA
ncbi:cytochrome c biogenesis heme-transporting ATPase CcmA [Erwinia oleae]|uniref:cytochrome c biogenesis heme-transporting ATPase CcmA n=1 Tax=Erwinia oleae TaxID=796334 RepID=UPI000558CAE6|nr:cytochrome c biogenesis heme-transporting ATPase CcmA [Erwinia oleae]